jgi:hypothetical protein
MSTDLLQLWAKLIEERTAAQTAKARDDMQAACDLASALRDVPSKANLDFFKAQKLANKAWVDYFERMSHKPVKW